MTESNKNVSMFSFVIASAVFLRVINGLPANKDIDVLALVDRINRESTTWTADTYGQTVINMDDVERTMLGVKLKRGDHLDVRDPTQFPHNTSDSWSNPTSQTTVKDDLPESFSWVTDKGNYGCPIGDIRDQANCGSCWAVSTASAFGDRLCLATKGKFKTPLSARHLTSCEKESDGCSGGYPNTAHEFLVKKGLVTGGGFDSEEGCQPYPIQPCSLGQTVDMFYCFAYAVHTPKCRADRCTNTEYLHKREPKLFKASNWYKIGSWIDEYNVRKGIYEKGPATAEFLIQLEFLFYKNGIFVPGRSINPSAPTHAVRIVGWGVENGLKYWLIANSWGSQWGENGFFRMKRGVNALGIESRVLTADPIID